MIAPLLLLALVLGGTVAAGTGAEVYEHESVVTAPPPMVAVPMPTPRPAAPTKPHHNKPQAHKLVPVAPPVVEQPPAPPTAGAPEVPQEPRVVLPSPIEPPDAMPEIVHVSLGGIIWNVIKGLLWTLLGIGCVWAIWKGASDIIAIRKQGAIK